MPIATILGGSVGNPCRTRLFAPLTLYCNVTTGSDIDGNGSAAAPFASPVGAYAYVRDNLDLGGHFVTAQLENSYSNVAWNFDGPLVGALGPQSFVVQGTVGNQHAIVISGAPSSFVIQGLDNAKLSFESLQINPGAGGIGVVPNGGQINVNNVSFLTNQPGQAQAHALGDVGSTLSILVMYAWELINGGTPLDFCFVAEDNGMISLLGPITMTGTPGWTQAFSQGDLGGGVDETGATVIGAYTGPASRAITPGWNQNPGNSAP